MSPSPTSTLCRAPRRGRLLLVGGFTVPVIVLGSLLGATPANADEGVTTKSALSAAFAAAPEDGTPYTVSVTAPLTGDDPDLDSLVVPHGADITLVLGGNEVDLDAITVENAASLRVQDTSATAPGLRVGTAASRDSSSTAASGIVVATSALLTLSSVHVEAEGSEGVAGIGIASGTHDVTLRVDGGSVVDAKGGAGAAGIGGGVDSAGFTLTALVDSEVTATAGPVASTASDAVAASSIGHGEGSAGPDGVELAGATVHVPEGTTLDVAAQSSLSLDGDSVLDVAGALTGAGSVSNDGSIVPSGSGTIDPDLDVSGNDYLVTFDANGGTTTAPASRRIYARTMQAGGYQLSKETGSAGDESLVGWTNPFYGGWWGWDIGNVDQFNLRYYSDRSGEQALTFTAQYEHPVVFTSQSLNKATLGTKFEQQLPVTGDAKWFYVSSYYDGDDGDGGLESLSLGGADGSDDALNGLPAGLQLNSSTGVISGYPSQPGHYRFTAYAYSQFQYKTQVMTIDVAGAPVFATSDLPGGVAGSAYSTPIVAVGDGATGSTTFSVSGGKLPAGMSLSTDGVLSGTPKAAGSYSFGVKATNDYGSTKTAFDLEVGAGAAAAVPAPTTPPSAAVPASTPAPTTPVLPVVAPTEVKLGHQFQLSVAADSTEAVTYSVPAGELPKGLSLDAKTGLITGVPQTSGHFVVHVTAKTASGSTLRAYSIDVPEPAKRITGNISRVTPKSGQAVKVAIRGLKVGERWTVFVDGKPAQTGTSKFGGSVFRTVHLPKATKDTAHVITVAGAKTSADPSVLSSARLHVTTVAAKKTLKITRSGATFSVSGLASQEKVTVKQGNKKLASGRADANGVFTFDRAALKAGKHTLKASGSTATRSGALTFSVKG